MCIIALKPADTPVNLTWLAECWAANPDGAGLMYRSKGAVRIRKGFMTFPSLTDYLNRLAADIKAAEVCFHFRWATHGSTCPGNTHPFPLTESVSKLTAPRLLTPIGLVHNGIITEVRPHKELSDTMVLIQNVLADLGPAVVNQGWLDALASLTYSKFCLMDADQTILAGHFYEEAGWQFSTRDYLPMKRFAPHGATYSTQYGWEDMCDLCGLVVKEGELNGDHFCKECVVDSELTGEDYVRKYTQQTKWTALARVDHNDDSGYFLEDDRHFSNFERYAG